MLATIHDHLTLLIERWNGGSLALRSLAVVAMLLLAIAVHRAARFLAKGPLAKAILRSGTPWDDPLVRHNVLMRLCHLLPGLIIYKLAPVALDGYDIAAQWAKQGAGIYMILTGLAVLYAVLDAALDVYRMFRIAERIPLLGLMQAAKVVLTFLSAILILSVLVQRQPTILLTGLGAFAAVLMLVFKDFLLGLVAGIQLSTNNMVRRGDWIEMPEYGADGDVVDIGLVTVKVRNWDKTVSTIPTYALVTSAVKNWRGMSESGGRRIKRAIYINIHSIRFCTEEMLQRFRRFECIADYIDEKAREVAQYNKDHEIDDTELINGRRLTNIGTFRAYAVAYLRNHPMIHNDMTFLVRQLQPAEHGLPIQIYVFSTDQRWVQYEAIQADIFDHLLASVPLFDLEVFQSPSGSDFRRLTSASQSPAAGA